MLRLAVIALTTQIAARVKTKAGSAVNIRSYRALVEACPVGVNGDFLVGFKLFLCLRIVAQYGFQRYDSEIICAAALCVGEFRRAGLRQFQRQDAIFKTLDGSDLDRCVLAHGSR